MTHKPRTTDEIYDSLKNSLTGKISKLTNFTERSFNYIWTRAFASELREVEELVIVSELAGWIDYVGGPVSKDDLERLGIEDDIDPEDINDVMEDQYIDEFVKIVGIERFPGTKATAEVEITTESAETTVDEGTVVTTDVDETGEAIRFVTKESITTAQGVTTVSNVPIEAEEAGVTANNIPAGEITRFANPPVGVRGVVNTTKTTGGKDEESNDELRERAKLQVAGSSEGGTVEGIKAYIRKNIDQVRAGDVFLNEFASASPIYVEVFVDGGSDSDVRDAIETARPAGIEHILARPQVFNLGVRADVIGTDIETGDVEAEIEEYIVDKGIGENIYNDEIISIIRGADEDIVSIDFLDVTYETVVNERFEYDPNNNGKQKYKLELTYEKTNGSISIEDEDGVTYSESTDFQVIDETGDGIEETVDFSIGGASPDQGDFFYVEYDVTTSSTSFADRYHSGIVRDEELTFEAGITEDFIYESGTDQYVMDDVPFADGTSSIERLNDNTTYDEGTDYEIVDSTGDGVKQTIDWSTGGSSPNDSDEFRITFDKSVYQTVYDIKGTPTGEITDGTNTFTEGTDYDIIDYSGDNEEDSVSWSSDPSALGDGDNFYLTYETESNIFFENTEKAQPSNNRITVTVV